MKLTFATTLIFWVLSGFLNSTQGFASEIVIRHIDTSAIDFQIYREIHPELKTLSMTWDQRPSLEEKVMTCFEQLKLLQEARLEGRATAAYQIEEDLWEQRFQEDWPPALRNLFLETGLSIAKRKTDRNTQRQLIQEAFGFATSFSEVQTLSLWKEEGFRAILRSQWNSRKIRNISLQHLRQAGFHVLRLNGVSHPLDSLASLKLPEARYRMTLLSNSWSPWTKVLEASQIPKAEPEMTSIVQGSCEKPYLHPFFKDWSEKIHVVFDRVCARVWNDGAWSLHELDKPSAAFSQLVPPLPLVTQSSVDLKKAALPLLVVGIVTGSLILFLKNQASANENPSNPSKPVATGTGQIINFPQRY